jgi:YVTN family beta-propeller protein
MKPTTSKRYFGGLGCLSFLLALPSFAATVRIYVNNSAGDSIQVIDPTSNKVVQTIGGIETSHGITFSPDGTRVYISCEIEHVLDVVDQKSGKIIKKIPLSGRPNNIAITKDGGRVMVGIHESPGALDIVNTRTLEVSKIIPMENVHNVYVTPDDKYAVAGSLSGKVVTVVDLQTEEIAWQLKFDKGIRPMAFDTNPDGSTRRIYTELSELHGFAIVDFATHKEVERIILPDEPTGYGVAEGLTRAPSHGIGVAPDGKTLWVNSCFAKSVFVYSLPALKLLGHASVGNVPAWLTFTPDSKRVYVTNAADRSVSVIDTKTLEEVARVPVGEVPKRISTLELP